ncbi:methyltransferase domain protein [Ceratobasidium sp. AG-Ba]|nr:methyltransferase domain protein [Ceratobasidium sp. AG-Ba]
MADTPGQTADNQRATVDTDAGGGVSPPKPLAVTYSGLDGQIDRVFKAHSRSGWAKELRAFLEGQGEKHLDDDGFGAWIKRWHNAPHHYLEESKMGVFAYYDVDTEGTVYHVIPSPTSEFAPSSIYSETESSGSGETIESDDLPGYFVLHHGRQHPASDRVAKWFPSDNIRRYTVAYLVARSIFGGDYVGPVREMLAPLRGRKRQVLELGTRIGTWIQTMATQFPHVQFRTVDVVPMMPHVPRHNVVFEVYDFTEKIEMDDESQDAVFFNNVLEVVRIVMLGIGAYIDLAQATDYHGLIREAHRVLRPGGLIYINDFNPGFWDPADITTHPRHTNPRGCHLLDIVRQRMTSVGVDPDTCDQLPRWLAPGSEVWTEGQKGFKGVESVMAPFPGYPHDGCPCMDRVEVSAVSYFRHVAIMSMRDLLGVVKDSGVEDGEAERLIEDTIGELKQHERCVLFKSYCIYGIKI